MQHSAPPTHASRLIKVWLFGLAALCVACAGPTRAVRDKARVRLGTAHPLVVQAVAPDGSWVAVCQARANTDGERGIKIRLGDHGELFGDDADLYLLSDRQPLGEKLDEMLAADATGRWVAFVRNGQLILRDMRTGRDHVLRERDTSEPDSKAFADFDAAGTQVLFARGAAGRERLVLRDLAAGTEREIATGPGRIWRAEFVGGSAWLEVAIVSSDTNGNHRLDLPTPRTSRAQGPCVGPWRSYSFLGYQGDSFEWRTLRTRDVEVEARKLRAESQSGIVVQDGDALRWLSADGDDAEIVPASCGGHVLAISEQRAEVLAACEKAEKKWNLSIYSREGVHDLGITQEAHYSIEPSHEPIVTFNYVLVDLELRRVYERMREGEFALYGHTILEVAPGSSYTLRFRDLVTNKLEPLDFSSRYRPDSRQFGRFAALRYKTRTSEIIFGDWQGEETLLFDLETRRIVAKLPTLPIVMRPTGEALVPERGHYGVLKGPLYWLTRARD